MFKKEHIANIREALKSGEYVLINPSIHNSSLKKSQAPQGYTDEEIKQGIVLKAVDLKDTLC